MDNFRRASLYVKELPVNARRLETSDYNTTIVKNVYIPLVSDLYSLSSDEISKVPTNRWQIWDTASFKPCTSTGSIVSTYNKPYSISSDGYTAVHFCFWQSASASNNVAYDYSLGLYIYMRNSDQSFWPEGKKIFLSQGNTGNNRYFYIGSSSGRCDTLPEEFYNETFTLDNPLYIKVSCKAISPNPNLYPYIKFIGGYRGETSLSQATPSTSVLMKYPIYIEPVE